jgi:hypothetical protein
VGRNLSTGQRVVIAIVLAAIAVVIAAHVATSAHPDPTAFMRPEVGSTDTYFIVTRPSTTRTLIVPLALTLSWGIAGLWLFRRPADRPGP